MLARALSTAVRFRVMVAWAQVSGLDHLHAAIRRLRKRGGTAEAIVGIDQGIATIDGLKATMRVFAPAYVFHDRGHRTYHPKLYIAEGKRTATVVIGSANLTEGGLFLGYETAVVLELDRGSSRDAALLRDISRYFDFLVGCGQACRPLDLGFLTQLKLNPRLTKSKRQGRRERREARKFENAAAALFGGAVRGLGLAPKRDRGRKPSGRRRPRRHSSSQPSRAVSGHVVASWFKRLTASDAMRKPAGSHERRHVILSKAGQAINPGSFFRRNFFGDVGWTTTRMHTGRRKDIATIPFDVFIENRYLGQYSISVDHAPTRVADQNNSPTWLNWSSLATEIKARDFRGHYLRLQRLSNGRFRLTLSRRQPGI
jgi:hypothetical protein